MENSESVPATEPKNNLIDIQQVKRDRKYWEQLSEIVTTWKLRGFTERRHASFWTQPALTDADIISVTGSQRDQLMKAFKRYAKQNGTKKAAARKK
jgi:hypothetical protein